MYVGQTAGWLAELSRLPCRVCMFVRIPGNFGNLFLSAPLPVGGLSQEPIASSYDAARMPVEPRIVDIYENECKR